MTQTALHRAEALPKLEDSASNRALGLIQGATRVAADLIHRSDHTSRTASRVADRLADLRPEIEAGMARLMREERT